MKDYKVMEVGRGAVDHLIRRHYLHKWPGVVVLTLALVDKGNPIGVVVFALPPRETAKRYGVSVVWKYSRKSHIPQGAIVTRVKRRHKLRFVYYFKDHEARRQAARKRDA